MKFLAIAFCLLSQTFGDMNPPQQIPRSFRWEKLVILNHNYIAITENAFGAPTQIKHDPDCHCKKFTEEMIAKVIAEVLRLKENQKPEQRKLS